MIRCEIRLFGDDSVLETREMETLPGIGEEVVVDGVAYQTATTPADVVDNTAIVYVKKV